MQIVHYDFEKAISILAKDVVSVFVIEQVKVDYYLLLIAINHLGLQLGKLGAAWGRDWCWFWSDPDLIINWLGNDVEHFHSKPIIICIHHGLIRKHTSIVRIQNSPADIFLLEHLERIKQALVIAPIEFRVREVEGIYIVESISV